MYNLIAFLKYNLIYIFNFWKIKLVVIFGDTSKVEFKKNSGDKHAIFFLKIFL